MKRSLQDYLYFHPKERLALVGLLILNAAILLVREVWPEEDHSEVLAMVQPKAHEEVLKRPAEPGNEVPFIRPKEGKVKTDQHKVISKEFETGMPNSKEFQTPRGSLVDSQLGLSRESHVSSSREIEPIEINSATKELWESLPGIGEKRASGIVKYREMLGGFSSIGQLAEVYSMPDSVVERVSTFLRVDESAIQKLDLNHSSFSGMLRHPYMDYALVKQIFRVKDQGRIESLDQIQNLDLMSDSLFRRIAPYLSY
jgi:competence ComEA-like helix-hairpin-helix protein